MMEILNIVLISVLALKHKLKKAELSSRKSGKCNLRQQHLGSTKGALLYQKKVQVTDNL